MPWGNSIFPLLIVTAGGGFTGFFVYSPGPGRGNLIESTTATNGTDPFGNVFFKGTATYAPPVPAGGSTALVITLLSTANNAFFQYANPTGAVQGALISSLSSVGGTDPVTGHSYLAGFYGIDPVFGDTIQVVGANINLGQVVYTRTADLIAHAAAAPSQNPYVLVDAPEQGTASHMQMLWQGASPDATSAAQVLIGLVSGSAILSPVSNALLEVQVTASQQPPAFTVDAATTIGFGTFVAGDVHQRFNVKGSGDVGWGNGAGFTDSFLQRLSANRMGFTSADLAVHTAGRGLQVAEGANAKQGTGTLVAGTATIANTSVTANSRVIVTGQPGGANRGGLNVTTITAGTSFVVTSTNAADTGNFAYEIFEPG